jgi:uncharacterized protein YqeY
MGLGESDAVEYIANMYERADNLEKFKNINRKELSEKSDKELAIWQTEFSPDSPQYVLAEHEWQRRLLVDQIRSTRFAAFVGLLGTALGAMLGAGLTWLTAHYL